MTIRKKLIFIQLLTAFTVLVLASAVFFLNEYRQFKADLVDNVSSIGLLIGENTASALVFMDNAAADQVLNSLVVDPRIANACIYDSRGSVFATYSRTGGAYEFPEQGQGYSFQGGYLELFRRIVRNQENIGTVFLRADLSQLTSKVNEYLRLALVVLAIGMALSVLLSVLLQRAISTPLMNLVNATTRVSETADYSLRVAGIQNKSHNDEDELQVLSQSFNEMLDLIQKRDASLIDARDTLEQRVKERTGELLRAKDEAERANLAKSTFLANMSHEIRTPMNAILGYAQILRGQELNAQQKHSVVAIDDSGHHLMTLINSILDISKIESGREDLAQTAFDLSSVLESVKTMFQDRCQRKALALNIRAESAGNSIVGDENKLRQVLINLVGNAVKFTEVGRVDLNVRQLRGDNYDFEVVDTGPGIDPRKHSEIFEPFQQEVRDDWVGGTGLGLTISRRHVELMGGNLSVESQLGEGARFFFSLNLPPGEGSVLKDEPFGSVKSLATGYSVNALVVDDIPTNLDILRQLLERVGVEVETADSGEQALSFVRRNCPDIVLTDIRMLGMDGREVRRRLVEEHGKRAMKIVAVSASVLQHERRSFIEDGFDGFVDKPIRSEQLYGCLSELLGVDFERTDGETARADVSEVSDSADWTSVVLTSDIFEGMLEATRRHSVTEVGQLLESMRGLGPTERHFADYLQTLADSFDMAGINNVMNSLKPPV